MRPTLPDLCMRRGNFTHRVTFENISLSLQNMNRFMIVALTAAACSNHNGRVEQIVRLIGRNISFKRQS